MSSHTSSDVQVSAVSPRSGQNRVGHGALFIYILAIVYASLNPFFGWRWPESYGLFIWPRYSSGFDIVLNVLSYIPLGGMLAALRLRRFQAYPQAHPRALMATAAPSAGAVLLSATIAAFTLSFAMESVQTMLPVRVSSPIDLIANTAGAFLGASVLVTRWGRRLLAAVLAWRHRHFAAGNETGWGLLLLAGWFVAQLNPVIPFFEAGHIAGPVDLAAALTLASASTPHDPLILLPQTVGIALNVCGFCLFLSLLLRPGTRVMVGVLLTLALGFFIKISTATLMLKAPQLAAWLGPATIFGLSAGLVLFVGFARIGYRWRAFSATLFIFAGGLMAKISSIYGAFGETLRLLNWPYGHLINFASLTRWMHESWPLLACLLAAWIFVKHRESQ